MDAAGGKPRLAALAMDEAGGKGGAVKKRPRPDEFPSTPPADDEPADALKRPRRLGASPVPWPLAPPQQHERRVVRSPRRRLFSIAFVWPEGVPWAGCGGGAKGRRAPRWYADCVTEMILHHGRAGASFIIHVHGALGGDLIGALAQQWRRAWPALTRTTVAARAAHVPCSILGRAGAFERCAARGETLRVSVCDAGLHPSSFDFDRRGPSD